MEDEVHGSTPDARASNDLIRDSLESAVDEIVRIPPEISGAKREGSLRTGGWGGAELFLLLETFVDFNWNN